MAGRQQSGGPEGSNHSSQSMQHSSNLPPEVARALGLHHQPAWQKYAPFGVFIAGASFLFGGTFLGIKWRMANYEADEENKRNAGTAKAAGTKRPRPGSLPTAPVAAPGAPPFSPAALAGKALIYGTSLAVGTTLAAVAGFCYVNDIKSVSELSSVLLRYGNSVGSVVGVEQTAPETDEEVESSLFDSFAAAGRNNDANEGGTKPAAIESSSIGKPAAATSSSSSFGSSLATGLRSSFGSLFSRGPPPLPPEVATTLAAASGSERPNDNKSSSASPAFKPPAPSIDPADAKYLSPREQADWAQFERWIESLDDNSSRGKAAERKWGDDGAKPAR